MVLLQAAQWPVSPNNLSQIEKQEGWYYRIGLLLLHEIKESGIEEESFHPRYLVFLSMYPRELSPPTMADF